MSTASRKGRILLVDDDSTGREAATFSLRKAGYEVDAACDGREGLDAFSPKVHDLVLTDIRMPGIDGMGVLSAVHKASPGTPVVMITAFPDVSLAVEAMRMGAADFLTKPYGRDHLLLSVERALDRQRLVEENRSLRATASGVERPLVVASAEMVQVLALADRLARSHAPVLVRGESGTGKELVARRIHARSPRAQAPFVPVNCAAIPPELIEAELFGHEKGAFTGAVRARKGRFRTADGGTLFLDEIGELSPSLQAKLLRVVQENIVDVVGSDESVRVDVRVICATNADLAVEVEKGRFRKDLFYRLNALEICIPPLRERPGDVVALASHFVRAASGDADIELPEDVLEELVSRPWPGNVRELENACERLVLLSPGGTLSPDALPPKAKTDALLPPGGSPLRLPDEGINLFDIERSVILEALDRNDWNVSRTAVFLRVPRHILAYRILKYGLEKA